jgi:trehalose-phosphatase
MLAADPLTRHAEERRITTHRAGSAIDVGIPTFWDDLASANETALLLDYDGTLAPFHVDRMAARPLPGIVDAFSQVADLPHTFLAIISGRPVDELLTLLEARDIQIAGSHGYERFTPGVGTRSAKLRDGQHDVLAEAERTARRTLPAEHVERKIGSVAVHLRGYSQVEADRFAQRILEQWQLINQPGLSEIRLFNGGIELRATGRHKGIVVQELLDELPSDTFAVYIGDDETDEDAFRVLKRHGIGIRVGEPDFPTAASGRLASCEAVRQFLCSWIEIRSTT